jgi:hypothetical protein
MKTRHLLISLLILTAFSAAYAIAEVTDIQAEFGFLKDLKGPAAMEVVEDPTIFRVAELRSLPCDTATFEFLLDRPNISMILARSLDPSVDDYRFKTLEDGSLHIDDHNGLTGTMELLASEPGKRIYYMTGHYELFWGLEFDGDVVLVPEFAEKPSEGGGVMVDADARSYFKVESAFVGAMASMVAYVFPTKVENRIKRFTRAITRVTDAIATDPQGMYVTLNESGRLTDGELDEFREFFLGEPEIEGGSDDG